MFRDHFNHLLHTLSHYFSLSACATCVLRQSGPSLLIAALSRAFSSVEALKHHQWPSARPARAHHSPVKYLPPPRNALAHFCALFFSSPAFTRQHFYLYPERVGVIKAKIVKYDNDFVNKLFSTPIMFLAVKIAK